MALFGKKDKDAKTEDKKASKEVSKSTEKAESKTDSVVSNVLGKDYARILQKPRITEKAAIVADKDNVYTFNIAPDATKIDVKKAIEKIYKVVPIKVAITKIPTKKVQVRGQRGKFGTKNGGKKAYVYLKKGDKIDFV